MEKGSVIKFTSYGQIKWQYIRFFEEREVDKRVDGVDEVDEKSSYPPYKEKYMFDIDNPSTPSTRNEGRSSTPSTQNTHLVKDKDLPAEYPTTPCPDCGFGYY